MEAAILPDRWAADRHVDETATPRLLQRSAGRARTCRRQIHSVGGAIAHKKGRRGTLGIISYWLERLGHGHKSPLFQTSNFGGQICSLAGKPYCLQSSGLLLHFKALDFAIAHGGNFSPCKSGKTALGSFSKCGFHFRSLGIGAGRPKATRSDVGYANCRLVAEVRPSRPLSIS